ncbi:MAG: hypothetical protein IT165_08960 [Bryobacterales bacterium]|nr:hypothetical protein [Bryobacterales bacterium]
MSRPLVVVFLSCRLLCGQTTDSVIRAAERGAPPAWAVLQRHLIGVMNSAAGEFWRAFTLPGGVLKKGGKIDDDYETFGNWPLFYALGGGRAAFGRSIEGWNGTTRRWTYERGAVRLEFVKHYDMLHLSEGYVSFQNFALADPAIPENLLRARRFAGFYLNEDPAAPNYDPERRILRSPWTGSGGPSFHEDGSYMLIYGHASLYPRVKQVDAARVADLQPLFDEMICRGDVPGNLAVTGLVTHAFLLTGDEKYKRWVLEYADGWMERIRANNGIIPDNVGLSGKTGEYRGGQWWGGQFGWNSRYSIEIMFNALITATESAYLLSGDRKYLDLLRSQVDVLLSRARIVDGNLLVPYRVGPNGWEDFRPLEPYILSHLWNLSMEADDWDRIQRVLQNARSGPRPYEYAQSPDPPKPGQEVWRPDGSPVDWRKVADNISHRNQNRHNEAPHLLYLAGDNPDWPTKVLAAEYSQVVRNLERIRGGTFEHEWKSQTVTEQNPVFTNGLAQMTTGAPDLSFNGGLLMARVRYYDADRKRPGLPEDIAALVEKLTSDQAVVRLVNTSAAHTRRVIIEAGAYGQHEFTSPQKGRWLTVELPPSTSIRLELGMRLFVNRPGYAQPWAAR